MSTPPTRRSKKSPEGTDGPFTLDEGGRLWLDPNLLAMDTLSDFDIVEWRGRYFELQGQRPSDQMWWVQEVGATTATD